jgi:hypothetical protein
MQTSVQADNPICGVLAGHGCYLLRAGFDVFVSHMD